MRKTILASAAVLALALPAGAVMAQDAAPVAAAGAMTAEQQTAYDSWPVERQGAYDGWSPDIQAYFWTLTPDQVQGWWLLTDEQRAQVHAMPPEQRTAAWAQISAQMNGTASAAPPASTPAATNAGWANAAANIRYESSPVTQAVPAGAAPKADGEYPPCKGDVKDGCVNPREAGLNYGNRPLGHWPGKPASEKDEAAPAPKPQG